MSEIGAGRAVWRWVFPTVVLGALLPIAVAVTMVAAHAGRAAAGSVFRSGDLYLFAVTVLGSAWGQIGPIPNGHETEKDLILMFLVLAAAAWAMTRSFDAVGEPMGEWLTLWGGGICLAVAAAAGTLATLARHRSGAG